MSEGAQEDLQREVEALLQFVYLTPVAIARLGAGGSLEMINPMCVQLMQDLGLDTGTSDGLQVLDMLSPALRPAWLASEGQVGPVLQPTRCDVHAGDGRALHLLVQLVRADLEATMLVVQDLTVTVQQERQLIRQRRQMGLMLEHIHGYCVAMLDVEGRVAEWNPSLERVLDLLETQAVGMALLSMAASGPGSEGVCKPPDFSAVCDAVRTQGWCRVLAPWQRPGQAPMWGDCMVTALVEGDGEVTGYVAVIRDVSEDHERARQLETAAMTDPLTGLHNRRGLESRWRLALGAVPPPQRVSWIMVDIDHFKRVNDAHGHEAGDVVLRAVADGLAQGARERDALARLGGEEFVLMLPGTTAEVAARVAERLRTGIQALRVAAGPGSLQVTASFGVCEQQLDEPWAHALERADAALYRAKHQGRNQVCLALPMAPSR
jgi:diguanylate cyclase (GGDEF)-like protein